MGEPTSRPAEAPPLFLEWYGRSLSWHLFRGAREWCEKVGPREMPGSSHHEVVGGWTSAFATPDLAWAPLPEPDVYLETPFQLAHERMIDACLRSTRRDMRVAVTFHFGWKGHSSGRLVSREWLLDRATALAEFRESAPGWQRARPPHEPQGEIRFAVESLRPLFEFIRRPACRSRVLALMDADPELLAKLELDVGPSPGLARCPHARLEEVLNAFLPKLNRGGASVVITVALLPKTYDAGWVERDRKDDLRDAAEQALDAIDLAGATGPGVDPVAALSQIRSLWEVTRAEVKTKLEEVIVALSKVRLDTFDEKKVLAAEIQKTMELWGFRAVSPDGNPAILRCNQTPRNPNGYFLFDEGLTAKSQDGTDSAQRRTRGAPAQLPAFKLVDRPPDRRRTET